MQSIGAALTLDFFRKGRANFLLLLVIPLLWPLLMVMLIHTRIGDQAELSAFNLRMAFFMTLLVETLTGTVMLASLQVSINQANLHGGFPARLYTLPVSTARLIFWQILPAIFVLCLVHLEVAVFFRLLTGVMPPLLEPILFLIMIYVVGMAVVWVMPGFAVLRIAVLAAVAYYPGLWYLETYSPKADLPAGVVWASPTLDSGIWMPLATVAAYGLTVWGVARDRHGEAWSLAGLKTAWAALRDRVPQRHRPFASPEAAQFWFELRQKGWIMPAAALLLVVVIPAVCLSGKGNRMDDALEALCGLPFYVALPIALIAGIFMGRNELTKTSANDLDLFRATRPISDAALSSAMFKVGLFNIVSSMAICVAAALVMTAFITLTGHGDVARQVWQQGVKEFAGFQGTGFWAYPLTLALAMFASWIILSASTVLGQAGHGRLMAKLTGTGIILVITFIFIQFGLPAPVTLRVIHATLIALGAAFLFSGGTAILFAWRRRLTASYITVFAFGVWIFLAGLGVWAIHSVNLHVPAPVSFFGLGVITLAPATPFLGALAIGWNRHR